MKEIIYAVVVLAALGLIFGIVLAVASKAFFVKVDEREEEINDILPGANCGACGFAGCAACSAAIIRGTTSITSCTGISEEGMNKVAALMGSGPVEKVEVNARVRCVGTSEDMKKFKYEGISDCLSASKVGGGSPNKCSYGCLGLGTCVKACKFDAMTIKDGLAWADPERCTGCGACVRACPKHIIELVPEHQTFFVSCASQDSAKDTMAACKSGCIGCGLCVKKCPSEAITVVKGVAIIDYDKCTNCGVCAEVCPRKIIHRLDV